MLGSAVRSKTALVKVEEINSQLEGRLTQIRISNNRPPSTIGAQGEHVSAYAVFKLCVEASLGDNLLKHQ